MSETAILFLHALSGLHPGSGTALGVVDLPVQRERHTGWPTIPGSSVKGVLRDASRGRAADPSLVAALFGPGSDDSDRHAGALSVSDARVIAFPVRSLTGVFAWTTCPMAWARLERDVAMAGGRIPAAAAVAAGHVGLPPGSPIASEGTAVLEEFAFKATDDASGAASWLADAAIDGGAGKAYAARLAMLPDDDFTHFTRHATEVSARIGLDYRTKTVRTGALFYEEFIPPESLFYCLVFAGKARNGSGLAAEVMMRGLADILPPVVQLGAGETIGKGFCATRLVPGRELRS